MATKAERRAAFQASAQGQLHQQPDKKPDLSKAERRAKQEAQRAAKAAQSAQNGGGSSSGKGHQEKSAHSDGSKTSSHAATSAGSSSSQLASTHSARPTKGAFGSNSTSSAQQPSASTSGSAAGAGAAAPTATSPTNPSLSILSHLTGPPLHSKTKHDNLVHPSIARLALAWSHLSIVGTNARAISMLSAFQDMLRSYTCPEGSTLARHFPTAYLSPQIECLYRARMRSLTLGNAIRWFKAQVAECRELSEADAKDYLIAAIDGFIRERIILADQIIVKLALDKIRDGQVVLTYGRSSVVERILLEAKKQGKRFSVVVADALPLLEGKRMLASLTRAGIDCTYILISALGPLLPRVSLVLLGTHALLSNGSMFSRSGTATVALLASNAGKPVVCCCETYKFSEKVMLDSIGGNELLPAGRSNTAGAAGLQTEDDARASLMYDVARPEDVSVVISEAGLLPTKSVPAVMKDYKPLS